MNSPATRMEAFDVDSGDARRCGKALALDVRRAVQGLNLDSELLCDVLGIDADAAAMMRSGNQQIAPDGAVAERLFLLVRLHRGLGDVYGSTERMDEWLDAEDATLHGRPRDLIRTLDGLKRVVSNVEKRCKDCLW